MVDSKRKAMIFLALAFILAILTAWLVINQVNQAQAALGQTTKIAVANTDIPAYTEISSEMIDWVDMPESSQLPSLVQNVKELEGNVTIVNLEKGEPFTANLVRPRTDIPPDHRIVWLNPTDNVLMDQSIVEGDSVDIIVSYQTGSAIETKRILENIPIVQSEELKSGNDETATALKVSLPVAQAEQLIHMQNTAQQVRVLRLNQLPEEEPVEGEQSEKSESSDSSEQRSEEQQSSSQGSKKESDNDSSNGNQSKENDDKEESKDDKEDKKSNNNNDNKDDKDN